VRVFPAAGQAPDPLNDFASRIRRVRHCTRMTVFPDENPLKRRIIEKGFLEDKKEFAQDASVHFVELCDACRRGDLEAVQTYIATAFKGS
jgi:hypothetical protein